MPGRFIMAAAVHTWHLGSFKSVLSYTFRETSYIRHTACPSVLCVGYPRMKFLSVRHKRDMNRDHFAGSTQWRGGCMLIFVVHWYCFLGSSHKEMRCGSQKSLSANASCHKWSVSCHFEMAEVALAALMKLALPCRALQTSLSEKLMPLFSFLTYVL